MSMQSLIGRALGTFREGDTTSDLFNLKQFRLDPDIGLYTFGFPGSFFEGGWNPMR